MSTSGIGKSRRLQEIYSGAAIAIFVLIAGANGAWVPGVAAAALGLSLFLFPAERKMILISAVVAAVIAAVLVLVPRLLP